MCSVSVMADWGGVEVPLNHWTRPAFNEFQEILLRLRSLDEKLNQPECEDPDKLTWMREVEKRLETLEAK